MRRGLAGIFVLAGAGLLASYTALRTYDSPGPLPQGRAVVVPRGSTAVVGRALHDSGVLDDALAFRVSTAITVWQGPLRSGEFYFPDHASLEVVLAILRAGRPVQHLLTIPEGLTASRLAVLVAHADGLVGDIDLPREGETLPESYAYQRGATRASLLSRLRQAMRHTLADAWTARDGGLPLRSAREMLILASLVERETHLPAERPLVARVFLNRLQRGMRLQSDPTVIYVESGGGGELPYGLTRQSLERLTPYNTYVLARHPTAPICAPGRASIEAVAHPSSSMALYFVADGTGGHAFADNLAEHLSNVRRYRQLPR